MREISGFALGLGIFIGLIWFAGAISEEAARVISFFAGLAVIGQIVDNK